MTQSTDQLAAWLNGTTTGGPNGDGRYPLTGKDGEVHMVYCPAATAAGAQDEATDIENLTNAAQAAASDATGAKSGAESARDDAQSAQTAAESAKTAAGTSEINAANSASNAADSAQSAANYADAANTSKTEAASKASDAGSSATASANSAGAAANSATDAQNYAQEALSATVGSLVLRGDFDASTGAYPTNPTKGDLYTISVAGTIDEVDYQVDDELFWDGSAWKKINNSGAVTSVAGRTGNVTLSITDIASLQSSLNAKANSSDLGTAAAKDVSDFASPVQGAKADSALQPANVGTAAAKDVGDFASAEQGAKADSALQPANVGTAAAKDVGDFASAEQGAKADSAVQPSDLADYPTLVSPTFDNGESTQSSTAAITLTGSGYEQALMVVPNSGPGSYNPMSQAGDTLIVWGNQQNPTNSFTITPWADSKSGLRISAAGDVQATGEVKTSSPNAFRMNYGSYGVFWRQDGGSLYLMKTAVNDQDGSYDSARPFQWNFTNNVIQTQSTWTFTAHTSFGDGVDFGNRIASNHRDFTNHINLHENTWGFAITPGYFNYVAGSGSDHIFWAEDANLASIGPSGITTAGALVGSRIYAGYDSGTPNSISCSAWFRSSGKTGWYNSTYGGGVYMTDSTYVRTYSGKAVAASDFVISSDRRLKTAIRPLEYRGRLQPKNFVYKADGKADIGFIAQEVKALYPEAVGVIEESGMYQLSYGKLTAVLAYQLNQTEDRVIALEEQLALLVHQLSRPWWRRLFSVFTKD